MSRARGRPRSPGVLRRRDFVRAGLGALALPLLPGCWHVTAPTHVLNAPRLTARPGVPTGAPVTGSSPLGLETGRDGILYVPASYAAGTPMPLLVLLHGAGGAGANWSSYYARAEARGMVLLAPDSRMRTWDLVTGSFGPDFLFLDQALGRTFDLCRIDPARVALAGFSDGASYALSMGLPNGDLFTHVLAYSPGFVEYARPLTGHPRVFVSHGTQDPIFDVSGTREGIVPSLRGEGYDVTYLEFAGEHEVPAVVSETALDWFFAA